LAAKTGLIFVWPEIIRGQLTLKIKKKLKKKKKHHQQKTLNHETLNAKLNNALVLKFKKSERSHLCCRIHINKITSINTSFQEILLR
jgi:hypothetical protein